MPDQSENFVGSDLRWNVQDDQFAVRIVVDDINDLGDESSLSRAWDEMGIRLQAATDQHAAMTEELEDLSRRDPADFTIDQVWTLIRAIKVQSQILQLYVGQPTVGV